MTQTEATTGLDRIIDTSTHRFIVQSMRLNQSPSLGSLIHVDDRGRTIYGVVITIETGSIEPGRLPYVRDSVDGDSESYLRENPHIALLLRTTYTAAVVGYKEDDVVRHYLPPAPPGLYAGVQSCSPEDTRRFLGDSFGFLSLLLSHDKADDALAACLRSMAATYSDRNAFLVSAGKALTVLLSFDPTRLTDLLRRIRP